MLNILPINITTQTKPKSTHSIILIEKGSADTKMGLEAWEVSDLKEAVKNQQFISIYKSSKGLKIVLQIDKIGSKETHKTKEEARRLGVSALTEIRKQNLDTIDLVSFVKEANLLLSLAEGMVLAHYQFQTYKSEKKEYKLSALHLISDTLKQSDADELKEILTGVYHARTLVNEPVITLTAVQIAKEIEKLGKLADFSVTIMDKKAIEKEKMGGLLAVNLGSKIPPTFTIMEYKPKNATNKKPYVLVGKGIVYDTGGLSLKPTAGSMDSMKSDMGGAASVIGAFYSIAKNKLPIHLIGLIPATDNRPGEDAYTPGDVITLHNGTTVEVLNTDAEGRLILGDALSYSKKYNPELVIDLATLTGAQVAAIGSIGAAIMGTANIKTKESLVKAGNETYERVAELPFWDEYGEMIKSDVADIKNVGGKEGGCITAGKFLQHFACEEWIHIDIAGPSFLTSTDQYKPKGGTGYGVRLLYEFFKSKM